MSCFVLPFLIVGAVQSSPSDFTIEYLFRDVVLTQTIPIECTVEPEIDPVSLRFLS